MPVIDCEFAIHSIMPEQRFSRDIHVLGHTMQVSVRVQDVCILCWVRNPACGRAYSIWLNRYVIETVPQEWCIVHERTDAPDDVLNWLEGADTDYDHRNLIHLSAELGIYQRELPMLHAKHQIIIEPKPTKNE